jgi:hypothetical protein
VTRYYVDMSVELAAQVQNGEFRVPAGWRLVERWGPRNKDIERWLVEDDNAGEEFEGYLISPVFRMQLIGEGPDYAVEVTSREIQ